MYVQITSLPILNLAPISCDNAEVYVFIDAAFADDPVEILARNVTCVLSGSAGPTAGLTKYATRVTAIEL